MTGPAARKSNARSARALFNSRLQLVYRGAHAVSQAGQTFIHCGLCWATVAHGDNIERAGRLDHVVCVASADAVPPGSPPAANRRRPRHRSGRRSRGAARDGRCARLRGSDARPRSAAPQLRYAGQRHRARVASVRYRPDPPYACSRARSAPTGASSRSSTRYTTAPAPVPPTPAAVVA